MKRKDYINWDELFITIAAIVSFRSKDPSTQHGSVIVDPMNRVVSVGYNGFPRGCPDDIFPWTSPEKYNFVVHSERNAIDNATKDISGCKLYLYSEKGYYPCCECAKGIIQKGLSEIIIAFDGTEKAVKKDLYNWENTRLMFQYAGIAVRLIDKPVDIFTKISQKLQQCTLNF